MITKNIPRYMELGAADKHWYENTKATLKDLFLEEDVDQIIDILAATSIHSTLKSNVVQFVKARYQLLNDLPFTGYLPNIITQLEYIKTGQELSGRKIRAFAAAMKGDPEAVVVDLWIMRAFYPDGDGRPSNKQYDRIEQWMRAYAPTWDLQPRQLCAMVWGGIRREQGYFKETTRYCDVLRSKFVPCLFTKSIRYSEQAIYINQNYFKELNNPCS